MIAGKNIETYEHDAVTVVRHVRLLYSNDIIPSDKEVLLGVATSGRQQSKKLATMVTFVKFE